MNRLVTIPFSHYCEKARWALARCGVDFVEDGHLPMLHYLPARRAGGGRTVPVLVTEDRVLTDSTDIAAWADGRRPGALLGDGGAQTAEALALEDDFDRQLGPATRRWGYFQVLPRKDLIATMGAHVPAWEMAVLRVTRPLALAAMRRGMTVTAEGAERSRQKIDATFARVGELLADGRRYLTGERFTIADLTFAALATPVVLPIEHAFGLPPRATFTGEPGDRIDAWRASPAGRFALRLYAEDRLAVA